MVRTQAQFKLDVQSQKAQGIYKNTNNSLTGASASSAGAIHYATTTPPSNPMVMTRRGASSAIVKQLHGIRKRAMAKHAKAHKKAHRKLNHTKSMCVTTGTRQGQPSARGQPTAPALTGNKAC
jgi:type II secretory pathway component GspD/PulD (secretin)